MDSIERTELDTPRTTLLLTRIFAAPRALLFKLWTQPEHIVRWWGCAETGQGGETLVTVTFKDKDDQTELTLRHESFATEDACAAHGEGWTASLDRLAGYLAAHNG